MQLEKLNQLADELAEEAKQIVTKVASFCLHYAQAVKERPELRDMLINRGLTRNFLDNAERAGNGFLDSRLLLPSGMQFKSLRACPFSIQKQALEAGVEVWDSQANDVRLIPVEELSPRQCAQIFNSGTIRSPAQQRTWLAEHAPKNETPTDFDYQVTRKFVITRRAGKWSRALVKQWATEMGIV